MAKHWLSALQLRVQIRLTRQFPVHPVLQHLLFTWTLKEGCKIKLYYISGVWEKCIIIPPRVISSVIDQKIQKRRGRNLLLYNCLRPKLSADLYVISEFIKCLILILLHPIITYMWHLNGFKNHSKVSKYTSASFQRHYKQSEQVYWRY